MPSTLDILTEHHSSHWCHSQALALCSRDSRSNNYILHPLFEAVTSCPALFNKSKYCLPFSPIQCSS